MALVTFSTRVPQLLRRASTRALATAAQRTSSPTLLGTIGSSTLLFISGSIVIWPVADLVVAPRVIAAGLHLKPSETGGFSGPSLSDRARHHAEDPTSQRIGALVRRILDAANGAPDNGSQLQKRGAARLVLVSGPSGSGKTLAARGLTEEGADRPALYVSLREAAAPHDLLFQFAMYVYSSRKLGAIGTISQSLGIFWICAFDCLIGGPPAHTRAVHFSQVLSHTRRALRLQQKADAGGRRALVVIDNYETLLHAHAGAGGGGGDEGEYYRQMAERLQLWIEAVTFDEGLADVVVVGAEGLRPSAGERRHWRNKTGIADRVARLDGGTDVCVFRNSDDWRAYLATRKAP